MSIKLYLADHRGEQRIHVKAPFEMKDMLKETFGSRWNPEAKAWTFPATTASAGELYKRLAGKPLDMDSHVQGLMVDAAREAQGEAHKTADDLEEIPGKLPAWLHQKRAYHFALGRKGTMLAMDMGEQPAEAQVLTPNGWISWDSVEVGTQLIGSDGHPTMVEEVKPWVERELVYVVTSDGARVPCSPNHLWTVKGQNRGWVTVQTGEIEESLDGPRWRRLDLLPRLAPIVCSLADLPLDPYVLGILLAEGSLSTGKLRFRSDSVEIVSEVRRRGYSVSTAPDGRYHNITGMQPKALIEELGLTDSLAGTRFIPLVYLRSAVEQRLDLLRGLMDGDGTSCGRAVSYSTISYSLANDVSALVRSLGGSGAVSRFVKSQPGRSDEYRVTLGLPMEIDPFLASGKSRRRRRNRLRRIVAVERTGKFVPMRCVRISNEDGLYVTNDYVLTHNTGKSRTAVSLLDGWGSLTSVIVCPRSVVNVWPNQFALHSERDWHVVAPPNRKTVAQRCELIKKEWRMATTLRKPFAVVVNYEAFWREPLRSLLADVLDNSSSVFIMDESHRIKAPGGKASMAAAALGTTASRRLQLTGTPMPHSPLDLYAQFRALDAGVFGTSFTKFRARYAVMGGFEGRQVLDYQNQGELSDRFGSASFIVSKADAGLDLPPEVHEEKVVQLEPKTMKLYKSFAEQMIAEVDEGTVTAQNALVKLLRLQQITSGYMRDDEGVDHEVDTTKQDVLADVLSDLAPTEPVVVFCKFHHDLDAIHHVAAKLERRYGEISGRVGPGKAHYGLNEHSQMREDIDILGVQLQSGGVGIDLTRSAYAVYYSMGYSLGDYVQSLARLHRPGQTRSVTYLHLIAAGTIDRVVYRALANRQEVVDAVLGAAKDGFETPDEPVGARQDYGGLTC